MYPAGFWKCVFFPTRLFLSASFAGAPWLAGCIGTAFYSRLCLSRCSPHLCWEHIAALFTGSSGKPGDSLRLDDGLSQENIGKAQSCTYSSPQRVPNCSGTAEHLMCHTNELRYPDCKSNDCQDQTCHLQGNDRTYTRTACFPPYWKNNSIPARIPWGYVCLVIYSLFHS